MASSFLRGQSGQICREHLDRRGINHDTVEAFRFGFDPRRFDPVDKSSRPALLMPWITSDVVTALKYRFIDDLAAQDKGRRFTQKKDSQAILFGEQLVNRQQNQSLTRTLVAVEREINAATIYQATERDLTDVVSIGPKRNQAALDALDHPITTQNYARVLVKLMASRFDGLPLLIA